MQEIGPNSLKHNSSYITSKNKTYNSCRLVGDLCNFMAAVWIDV